MLYVWLYGQMEERVGRIKFYVPAKTWRFRYGSFAIRRCADSYIDVMARRVCVLLCAIAPAIQGGPPECVDAVLSSPERVIMKFIFAGVLMSMIVAGANAETENFDKTAVGTIPAGWKCGVTGRGSPRWQVEADSTAPSKPNVLKQTGQGTFPWCVKDGVSMQEGFVEVRFKSISGKEDQAGGVVWRWQDGDNYYVARANALENNLSLYYTENGSRKTIKYVDAPVPVNVWHALRVHFRGARIEVLLDGKSYIQLDDTHIAAAGAVGVWTKADSVTAFDDFMYGSIK